MGKKIVTLWVSVLFLGACNQKVGFGPAAQIAAQDGGQEQNRTIEPDPVCGDPMQPPHNIWVSANAILGPCPEVCPDGSTRKCNQLMEKEIACIEGFPNETGNVRPVGDPIPIRECPIMPKDCGNHANGTQWWEEAGQTSRICEICSDGTPHNCQKAVEVEKSCANGVESLTGGQRDGRFLQYENECLPPKPKDCGDHAHLSFWWEEVGKETDSCEKCWDGSSLTCDYALEGQKTCNDGKVQNAGFSRRGRLLQTNGQCPHQPKNCGDVANGSSEWRVNGQGAPYDCEVCVDGSKRRCVKAREEQVRCDDGVLNLTGQTRDGSFLGYLNSCPTDIVERTESVTATETAGKADVLFILDTTSSMYPSLEKVSSRFDSLISKWDRIDWQIAVTNAKVRKSFLDSKTMDGKFMELQKNDSKKPVEYIIKRGDPSAKTWFYRTMSRDPSDRGCGSQPYCMVMPPEPIHTLKRAIDQKDSVNNKGFFRDQAKLVVVMITDADEFEDGNPQATKPADAIKYFQNTVGKKMDGMIGLSVIIKPGDVKCFKRNNNMFDMGAAGQYGTFADEFARLTGGISASICDDDQGPALAKLSESVRQQLESITLKEVPMPGSLTVKFTPSMNVSWVLQGKKIVFDQPIPAGTQIDVRYLVKLP